MTLLHKMREDKLLNFGSANFVPDNTMYLTVMGSRSYGVDTGSSDLDVYGFCIPPKELVFPHLAGQIDGFGKQKQRFDVWQQHHIQYKDREYDLSVYNIVRYFDLVMSNNPNMLDSLFTPLNCVLHATRMAWHVRENRHLFLSKRVWHTFKGYAYSQMNKAFNRNREGKRKELVDRFGFDVKSAYHVVRLMLEVEEILTEGSLTLDKHAPVLKAIREGYWDAERIKKFFEVKESTLEDAYVKSTLPWAPDEGPIKALLLECLEEHYGDLSSVVHNPTKERTALQQVLEIAQKGLG